MRHLLRATEILYLGASALCTAGFLVVVSLQVFCRFVLEVPLIWSEEAARYLFVWGAFLGAAVAIGRRDHFTISILVGSLSDRGQRLLDLLSLVLVIVFCLLLIWFGTVMSWRFIRIDSPIIPVSQGLVYAAIPLCGLYGVLHVTARLASVLKKPESPRAGPATDAA
jgi:TRAP-type C4-dicarboxylate transport system permease small subunit